MNDQKITPIVFNGKTSEYFGIWIVNLLLTILTLGIYSAWAKVRRKKYFYNNTFIDNVGFDYHAKPIAILKGRIIAFVFFMAYAFGGDISPFIPFAAILIFFIALPWLVVRSATFNARNTSHRGLRFDFVGKLGGAFRVFFVLPIVTILTLWLAAPYTLHQKNKFLMSNHKFGMSQFDMQARVKSFYKVYWLVILVPLIGILAAIAIPAYYQYQLKAKAAAGHSELRVPFSMGFVDVDPHQRIMVAESDVEVEVPEAEINRVERVYADNSQLETAPDPAAEQVASEPNVERVYVEDMGAEMAQEGDYNATSDEMDVSHEKTFEEMMQERERARQQKLAEMLTHPGALLGVLGVMLAYIVVIFGFLGYIQARIGNLVWNNTTLDKLSFKSTLRARDLIGLYFSNFIAIVCTFGLATPWAQIRMAKYRTSKLDIIGDVDFDQFVGEKKAEMKATGEEIADFFDVDLSFG